MIVSRQGDWISAKSGEELVMMSLERGRYLGMNEVGARIWELIEQPSSVEAIRSRLAEEYEVDLATCAAEVDSFLGLLAEQGAVRFEA